MTLPTTPLHVQSHFSPPAPAPLPRRLTAALLIVALTASPTLGWSKTPLATGTGGAVATISEPASQAAMTIPNQGGNAIDAAVV